MDFQAILARAKQIVDDGPPIKRNPTSVNHLGYTVQIIYRNQPNPSIYTKPELGTFVEAQEWLREYKDKWPDGNYRIVGLVECK